MSDMIIRTEADALPVLSQRAEELICQGNLAGLSPQEKMDWYKIRCDAAGLDWRTQPFQYITLNGKLVLYATATAAQQASDKRGITTQITARESIEGVFVVTCRAIDRTGRGTDSIGAVPIMGLKGEALANAMMKSETKAKRRAVLSLSGLGMMDENEVDSLPGANRIPADVIHGSEQERLMKSVDAVGAKHGHVPGDWDTRQQEYAVSGTPQGYRPPNIDPDGVVHENVPTRPPLSDRQQAMNAFRTAARAIDERFGHPSFKPLDMARMVAFIIEDGRDVSEVGKDLTTWKQATVVLEMFRENYPDLVGEQALKTIQANCKTDRPMCQFSAPMWDNPYPQGVPA